MTGTRTRSEPSHNRAAGEATGDFFAQLPERHNDPLIRHLSGSIRFDLGAPGATTHWYVELRRGHVDVSHKRGPADCVMATDVGLFDEIVSGRANALAAVLRGAATADGDLGLIMSFQRLFGARTGEPGPAGPRKRPHDGPAHDGPMRQRRGSGR